MTLLNSFDSARDLEEFLGDPLVPAGPLTYGQAVADDRDERFPRSSLEALHSWGYPAFQVPEARGGRLTSLEELVALGRVVARRDPAVAVIANAPLAAAMPVWLAGTPTQQAEVGRAVLDGGPIALGLTEEQHGADLLAGEVTARRTGTGYVVDGTKWLINNVRLARFLCLLVRDADREGLRSLSLLLVDLEALAPASYEFLPKIRTHGACGLDVAGVRFRDAFVPGSACIGRPGRGLELTAQSLVVTRTLVPALSLGALETALRCTLDFLRDRRLYGGRAIDIPFVQDELAAAFLDLAVAEVVTACCVRVLSLLPDLAPISSAVAKYVVPHVVEARMRRLALCSAHATSCGRGTGPASSRSCCGTSGCSVSSTAASRSCSVPSPRRSPACPGTTSIPVARTARSAGTPPRPGRSSPRGCSRPWPTRTP
jgi:alkylation response protein AidB-like acyl-CoA dehydrogenase